MGGWIALILFVGVPVAIPIVFGARRAIVAWRISRTFQLTEGVILSSHARLHVWETPTSEGGTQTNATWYPEVQFRYRVAGVEHDTGTYAHPAGVSSALRASEERVKAVVAAFAEGQTYPAWYDPRNPAVAYLHLESPWGGIWTIVKTLIVVALVYAGLVIGLILIQRQR